MKIFGGLLTILNRSESEINIEEVWRNMSKGWFVSLEGSLKVSTERV
jgi:hypothetical protein